jgi:hypothetical protein
MRKKGKGADIKKHNDNCDAYDASKSSSDYQLTHADICSTSRLPLCRWQIRVP